MKKIIGVLGIFTGAILGLYVGVYVCLVGGIMDIINEIVDAVKGGSVSALAIIWGLMKIVFSSVAGWFCAFVLIAPSVALIGGKGTSVTFSYRKKR